MYRPQSLDISNKCNIRYVNVAPHGSTIENNIKMRQVPLLIEMNSDNNVSAPASYVLKPNVLYHQNHARYRWLPRKIDNFDYQISNLIREGDNDMVSGLCQSQSFCEGPLSTASGWLHRGNSICAPMKHTSRLSACMYMSPPSPHWTTVGNIMSVKRSTSMPGSRPNSVSIPCQPKQRNDITNSSIKKKCGPFQCIKHQFRRGGHKDSNENNNQTVMADNIPSHQTKGSRSVFKKRPIAGASSDQNPAPKSKGLRKSISLLFSKSHRSSKSDPSIIMGKKKPEQNDSHIGKDINNKPYPHASRRNRSYESMLESGDARLCGDANKSCSYSDVQDSALPSLTMTTSTIINTTSTAFSVVKTKAAVSVEMILCRRSPSETSLSDTISVSSSEQLLSSQTVSCQGHMNYRTEDNGWKTVVGNVCRSNSKDSAIANSTLSGDGMINQSKRVSLTSTISRISDLTTASEDFNDSSYSSFNDLQMNSAQFYSYSKPRLAGPISNLEPIKVHCDTVESEDISPSSDSSTETLRPLSRLLCRPYRSSYSNVMTAATNNQSQPSKRFKRSNSWPGCQFYPQRTESNHQDRKPICTRPLQETVDLNNSIHFPRLKMSYIQQSHLNSSPLLSQYSRLYSLRTSAVNDQRSVYGLSSHLSGTPTQAPTINPSRHSKLGQN